MKLRADYLKRETNLTNLSETQKEKREDSNKNQMKEMLTTDNRNTKEHERLL